MGVQLQSGRVVAHDGRLHRSGRRLTMTHHHFYFDKVWPESASNDDVYHSVAPLLRRVLAGKDATVLCYGQTGTGAATSLGAPLDPSRPRGSTDGAGSWSTGTGRLRGLARTAIHGSVWQFEAYLGRSH